VRQVVTDPRVTTNPRGVSAQTEQSVMASTVVAEGAAKILGNRADPNDLLKRLTVDSPQGAAVVNSPQDTLVLTSTFKASTPEKARAGAQAFADAYLNYRQSQYDKAKQGTLASIDADIQQLQGQLETANAQLTSAPPNSDAATNALSEISSIRPRLLDAQSAKSTVQAVDTSAGDVIKPARLPTGGTGVSRALVVIATTVLGAMIGIVAALVRQRTDPYMRTRQDFVEIFDRPPLAEVNIGRGHGARRRASLLSPEVSEYRHLRARLWPSRPPKFQKILTTDVESSATTAQLVVGVATSLANAHWRVLVIWPDYPGTDFDASTLEEVDGIRLLPWSAVEGYSGDSIDPTALVKVLDEAAEIDDVVLLSGAPIQSAAEGPELYSLVDGVLVSFDPSTVRTDTVEAALDEVATMGGQVAGVVVSPVPGRW
jgi:hypothetical protein